MTPLKRSGNQDAPSNPTWTQQDDAEYNRLATEMNEDLRFQFTLFTFGITTTAAVLGLIASNLPEADKSILLGVPYGVFFLVPLVVLLPTSLMILNRARTRNRKAAYVMVVLEYKRLRAEGITDQTPLQDVKNFPFLPWETALHIIERTNSDRGTRVHLAPAIRYMFISYFTIEILCLILAFVTSLQVAITLPIWPLAFVAFVALAIIYAFVRLFKFRIESLARLTEDESVQGYVENWLKYKYSAGGNEAPLYLSQWIIKHYQKKPRKKLPL